MKATAAILILLLMGCVNSLPVQPQRTRNEILADYQGKTIEQAYVETGSTGYKTVFVFTDGTQLYVWNYKYTPSINKEGF